jgi:thiol-disulfide isomerase/thioredoxin
MQITDNSGRSSYAGWYHGSKLDTASEMLAHLFVLFAVQAGIFSPHGEKAVVLLFIRSDCPISNRYAPELQRLYKRYSPGGIDFVLVYPEPGLSPAAMKEHGREYGYSIPAVLDANHQYVARAKAQVTPEAAVFVHGERVYAGRIDDWYVDIGKSRAQPMQRDLEQEVSAILAGKIPRFHETKAVGCAIENSR